jgi:hypothetical protein
MRVEVLERDHMKRPGSWTPASASKWTRDHSSQSKKYFKFIYDYAIEINNKDFYDVNHLE